MPDRPPSEPGPGPAPLSGLSADEVRQRVLRGETNRSDDGSSRSVGQIVRANVVTPFNLLLGSLAAVVLAAGSWRDALFGLVVVANSLVGVVQEVRAKRVLDHLAVLTAPRARVVRDGTMEEVATGDVVLGDLLRLGPGDQIAADGVLRHGVGLEVDESLLTGESDHVAKRPGDHVLSGSFVAVGSGTCEVTAVGGDSFASRMTAQARRYTTTSSELVDGINRILRYVAVALVVVGPVLFLSQHNSNETWQEGVRGSVAGLVGIVPEGLVLLTSVAFFAAALSLARRRVLVQELPAVEGLARVDVLCVDKTGTLTEGDISFGRLELAGGTSSGEVAEQALAALAADDAANATLAAIGRAFPEPSGWARTGSVPFSSERKWSAAAFDGRGTWVLGAPEMVRPGAGEQDETTARAAALASAGCRTLLLAHTPAPPDGDRLPEGLEPVSLVVLDEALRPDAAGTIRYFGEQGVAVKVISGDNPRTVGAVARGAGVPGAEDPVDARLLGTGRSGGDGPATPSLAEAVEERSVFGRVVPDQKVAMVAALQSAGHVVAMTGDGVNDALALKGADIGIAMGTGAAATRSVAQLVLLDDQFSVMPRVVAEGRRVIANIERVAALFLSKNVSSLVLSVCVAVAGWPYPFLPRQITLVSQLAIGLPGFFLALAPNTRRFEPGFVARVLRFAVPAGTLSAIAVLTGYGIARAEHLAADQARTAATMVFLVVSLWIFVIQARPLRAWKAALVAVMAGLALLCFVLPFGRHFYDLHLPPILTTVEFLGLGAGAAAAVEVAGRVAQGAGGRANGTGAARPAAR